MALKDGTLVTGRESHEVFLMEGKKRRWVPDLWTMQSIGVSPADLQVVDDDQISRIEFGEPFESAVPAPTIEQGVYVETESGVYLEEGGVLKKVTNPQLLAATEGFTSENPPSVVYLPEALVRSLIDPEETI